MDMCDSGLAKRGLGERQIVLEDAEIAFEQAKGFALRPQVLQHY